MFLRRVDGGCHHGDLSPNKSSQARLCVHFDAFNWLSKINSFINFCSFSNYSFKRKKYYRKLGQRHSKLLSIRAVHHLS